MTDRLERPALKKENVRMRSCVLAMYFALTISMAMIVLVCSAQAQLTPLPADHDVDHLSGLVVNAVTHEPIGRALVVSADNHFAMLTDDRGRFKFTFPAAQKPPGAYGAIDTTQAQNVSLTRPLAWTARKVGFLSPVEGQVHVVEATQQELTIALLPEARIVGHVTVAGADGAEKMQLELYRSVFREGRERWEAAGNVVSTRVDGQFRIADLRPGLYKLLTGENVDRNPLDQKPGGQVYGYPPSYFAGAPDFATSAVIHLKAGETFLATISPVKREYYNVSIGIPNPPASEAMSIKVWPQGHPGPGYSLGYDPRVGAVVGSLPNGTYTLQAISYGPTAMAGMMNFTVAGAKFAGAGFTLHPGSSINVNVREELERQQREPTPGVITKFPRPGQDAQNSRRPNYLHVALVPDEEFGTAKQVGQSPATGPDDESLVIENVLPGRYHVVIYTAIGYASSITSGGTDLLRHPLLVVPGAPMPALEITMRDDGAELDGTVDFAIQTANGALPTNTPTTGLPPGPSATVKLVSMDRVDIPPKVAWCESDGKFTLQQIAPGAYQVFALEGRENQADWVSDEWLKQHESKVQTIELTEGQKTQLRLAVIKTDE